MMRILFNPVVMIFLLLAIVWLGIRLAMGAMWLGMILAAALGVVMLVGWLYSKVRRSTA